MKQKKVHLCKGGTNVCVCGFETYDAHNIRSFEYFIEAPEEERCKSCENRKYFAEMLAKKESERDLLPHEWVEPFEVLKFNVSHGVCVDNCYYNLTSKIGSVGCDKCKHNKDINYENNTVKCSYLYNTNLKKNEEFSKNIERKELKVDDLPFEKTNNHCSHYEKTNGELEQIDKMELIICHGLPKEYHQTVIDNLNLALASKYHDRLGKKDDTDL